MGYRHSYTARLRGCFLDCNVRDGVGEKIARPALVCAGADDMFFEGRPQQLFDHLTCQKTLLEFTAAEGAEAHCQVGAKRLAYARIFDWLEEVVTQT